MPYLDGIQGRNAGIGFPAFLIGVEQQKSRVFPDFFCTGFAAMIGQETPHPQFWDVTMGDPIEVEPFLSMLVELLTLEGCAREVSLLVSGDVSLEYSYDCFGGYEYHSTYLITVAIELPPPAYLQFTDEDKCGIQNIIVRYGDEVLRDDPQHRMGRVELKPILKPRSDWRAHAVSWLRGEGINNQGRVRSNNIAARQHDGLLFRSGAEVNLYRALKERGILFAPLPVFLRGGKAYQRIEPDFVLLWNGIVMVVEVDGDTVHRETPAEADKRTKVFKYEGVSPNP